MGMLIFAKPLAMRFGLFLSALLGICIVLQAQTFHPAHGSVRSAEVRFDLANECYLYFQNPSGDSLRLRWRRLEVSKPDDWIVDLCDYGACYAGIPPNSTMNFVHDTLRPYLKLIVQPGQRAGAAWFWFRVYELDNQSNFQDVYFSLYTPGTTALDAAAALPTFSIYPNPVRETLNITFHSDHEAPAQLLDAQGRLAWQGILPAQSRVQVPTTELPNGLYFLKIGNGVRRVLVCRD